MMVPWPRREAGRRGEQARTSSAARPELSSRPFRRPFTFRDDLVMTDPWRTIENPAIGDSLTFVRTAQETGGELTELEITLAPGGGNPVHYHGGYSERFAVIEGVLGVQVGRETVVLSPGEHAMVEAGTHHRFFNPGEVPVRFGVQLRPGRRGVEDGFRILYGLGRSGRTRAGGAPKSLTELAVVLGMTDMHAPAPLGLLAPLLRFLARRARANGTERALVEAYCTPPARPETG